MYTHTHTHTHADADVVLRHRRSHITRTRASLRGWRNTVELVLLDISNPMKPYPLLVSRIYR